VRNPRAVDLDWSQDATGALTRCTVGILDRKRATVSPVKYAVER